MPDILTTSLTGLNAYQAALATTSHNIANVGTEGYSRQDVELATRTPLRVGDEFIGQGVLTDDVRRIVNNYVTANIREFTSTTSRMGIFEEFATRVESLVANESGGLMSAMDGFFNSLNDVANDPAGYEPRVALLGAAEVLEHSFVTIGTEMQNMEQEADERISFTINEVNALTADIARLNDAIIRVAAVNQQPNDLLDKRDLVLKRLSEKMTVTVLEQGDGTLNVLMGSGQLLVTGTTALQLGAQADPAQPDRLAIRLRSTGGSLDLSNTAIGGELGGLLDFRNNLLDVAQNRLGRTAIALSETFNAQHVQGLDLNGNMGTNFFSTVGVGNLRGSFGGDYLNAGFEVGDTVSFDLVFDGQTINVAYTVGALDTNLDIANGIIADINANANVTDNLDGTYTLAGGATAGVSLTFQLNGSNIEFQSAGGPSSLGNTLVINNMLDDNAVGTVDARLSLAGIGSNSTSFNPGIATVGIPVTFVGPSNSAISNINNTGTGEVLYTISDVSALTVSDYEVSYDGANYTLLRLSDKSIIATSATGPFNIDGLDITVGGAINAGDSFFIRPTRTAAIAFQRIITDPNAVAAAFPIRTLSSVSNLGDVAISSGTITDATHADFLRTVDIFFDPTNPTGTFDVVDRATGNILQDNVAYSSNMLVSQNGWQVRISGSPEAGDNLTVEMNDGAATDNRNMLLLAGLQNQSFIDNYSASYEQSYRAMVSEIGTLTQQFKINLEVETTLLNNAITERESLSGVNLDEEAANLIKFQQAYQAMTRVVQTAQTLFNTLLEVV
ncbi:MAG: flagellar hook-associated protein FlgK [Gammaproteobacteria bacterium]|nr:flagellar hook-associated protein FlgK [Gammaproteobacteria bacterium]